MENNGGYPIFQWSKFAQEGKGEQYVVREHDFEKFVAAIEKVKGLIPEDARAKSTAWLNEPVREPILERLNEPEQVLVCNTCGQPATARSGISKKTGKAWKAIFCSTGDKNHAVWI